MKIEEGKCYRTRDGRKVGPMRGVTGDFVADHEDFDLHNHVWTPNGTQWWVKDGDKKKLDLIAEWTDEPEAEPTPWKDMTDAEKGALLLARINGATLQTKAYGSDWLDKDFYNNKFHSDFAYRVKPDPVVETVTMYGGLLTDYCWFGSPREDTDTHRITFTTKDGKPATGTFTNENGDVITMEEL